MADNPGKGLEHGISALERLTEEKLLHACQQACDAVKYNWTHLSVYNPNKSAEARDMGGDLENSVKALTYFFREALKQDWDGQQLRQHISSYLPDSTHLPILEKTWDANKGDVSSGLGLLNLGKLSGMEWKVGMATSSSQCRMLNTPIVTLQLSIQQPSGHMATHCMELTLAQFKDFSSQVKEMAASMSTV